MTWGITVGILCALSWALLDLQRKALTARHPDPLTLAALVPIAASVGAFGYAAIKGAPLPPPPQELWGMLAWIVLLNIAANFLFLHSLTVGELSKVIPLLSLTPAVGAIGGWMLFGELLGAWVLVGMGLVIVGTFLLLFRKSDQGRAGVPSMLAVTVLWGWIPALDKLMITGGKWSLEAYLVWATALIGLPLLVERLIRAPQSLLQIVKRSPWLLASLAPAAAAALGFQFESLVELDVGVSEALKRSGVVLTVLVGAVLFKEPQAFKRMPWILVVVAGACLVALAREV